MVTDSIKKQDFVTNPNEFRGLISVELKSYGDPRLFLCTIHHLSRYRTFFFYRASIARNYTKF